ncbi:MAG: response regulator [Bacteroidetes bacterium]|nr:MAG: response regulator [Bacteroidota bacterium]
MNLEIALLIDDSDIDNMVNKRVVQKAGLSSDITVKNSAQSAIDYLKEIAENDTERIPGVIFLDIRMPQIDGFGFLELFEELPDVIHNKSEIVMLSSSIDAADYSKAMENRFVKQFFNKPLHKESVINLVDI